MNPGSGAGLKYLMNPDSSCTHNGLLGVWHKQVQGLQFMHEPTEHQIHWALMDHFLVQKISEVKWWKGCHYLLCQSDLADGLECSISRKYHLLPTLGADVCMVTFITETLKVCHCMYVWPLSGHRSSVVKNEKGELHTEYKSQSVWKVSGIIK